MISKLIYSDLTFKIRGILFKVHNELGRYCNEKQYADLVENYLKDKNIKYEREKTLDPAFKSEMKGRNKVDFIIENKVLLELKAKRIILREDYYQVRRYLHSLKMKLGILVNFRSQFISPKRILNSSVSE